MGVSKTEGTSCMKHEYRKLQTYIKDWKESCIARTVVRTQNLPGRAHDVNEISVLRGDSID